MHIQGSFPKLLQEHANHAAAEAALLSLIMLDVDHFKQRTDTSGHLFGDEVLTTFCQTMRRHIKVTHAVDRWGGEEFVIFLPNAHDPQAQQDVSPICDGVMTWTVCDRAGNSVAVPTLSRISPFSPRKLPVL